MKSKILLRVLVGTILGSALCFSVEACKTVGKVVAAPFPENEYIAKGDGTGSSFAKVQERVNNKEQERRDKQNARREEASQKAVEEEKHQEESTERVADTPAYPPVETLVSANQHPYQIITGIYKNKENAINGCKLLRSKGFYAVLIDHGNAMIRVCVVGDTDVKSARNTLSKVRAMEGYSDAWMKTVK